MKKSWLVRHPFLTNTLVYVVFVGVGIPLGILINPLYFLLALLGLALYIGGFIFTDKWIWVCSKCGREQSWKREKYCETCGGEMMLKRAEILVKYCENGHRIEDSYNLAKVCPKCGKPFKQEKVELK